MGNDIEWIVVGRFGRIYGIKGFITIHSFTNPRDNLLNYVNWHVFIDNHWQPLKLVQIEAHNKAIVAQVEGYQGPEQVAALTNAEIAIDRAQLPSLDAGEYYWYELVGLQVINQQAVLLGTVIELLATGSNDVLIVEGKKRYLIPYLPGQYVLDVNKTKKIITVDWDEDF